MKYKSKFHNINFRLNIINRTLTTKHREYCTWRTCFRIVFNSLLSVDSHKKACFIRNLLSFCEYQRGLNGKTGYVKKRNEQKNFKKFLSLKERHDRTNVFMGIVERAVQES